MPNWDMTEWEREKNDREAFAVTSEGDHAHECPHCGGVWLHASDECQPVNVSSSYINGYASCPECERGW